ncbi:NAD(P)/FAD-dependent oxidoreductase [Acidovorax sp. A79]|uniref:NAD(P)/FAD-dependent oxidoreductase n=1 Tax=Acidovorax sp. A79 TaxID=3056107 RepID=UPI0034E8E0D6
MLSTVQKSPSSSDTNGTSGVRRHRVVIVGGGAAGMELATGLGRNTAFAVTLVDKARTHVWKPKLHEIAAGSMDVGRHEVGYLAHARRHGYTFRVGALESVDRVTKTVSVAAYVDQFGEQVTPSRSFAYDTLVVAVGSQSNDFGTPGVGAHALRLESLGDAVRFNRRLTNACFRAQSQSGPLGAAQLRICIIGAGATGVELAAELHSAGQEIFGEAAIDSKSPKLDIHLVEAAERILPALSPKVSAAAEHLLLVKGVKVQKASRVLEIRPSSVVLADGGELHAELIVWAAGVKAPDVLSELSGLQSNRANQLVVRPTLQTTLDENIFAIGDCAACSRADGKGLVPPRAQAAHQQAVFLASSLEDRVAGRPLPHYEYRDFGSLISLGARSTVGTLMGGLIGRGMFVEGMMAKAMYTSLYKSHEIALHGWRRVGMESVARLLLPSSGARVKLH